MPETTCDEVRKCLLEGSGRSARAPDTIRRHLAGCADCSREAEITGRLLEALAADAEVAPPPALDRAVRAVLATPAAIQPLLRPGVAASMAVASMFAFLTALGSAIAETGAAERGMFVAIGIVTAYLAFCATATLPIVILHSRRPISETHG